MKNKLMLCCMALFGVGCGYAYTHAHINGNGTYNYNGVPVMGNLSVDQYSCIGTCPALLNGEVLNAMDNVTVVNETGNSYIVNSVNSTK